MAQIISFINSKGGSGKTTLAFSIAVYWDKIGKHVLLVDADPQASLMTLYSVREQKGNMEAISLPMNRLEARVVSEQKSGSHDVIIIDTPGRLAEIQPAIDVSDVIVIPVQASGADYFAFQRVFKQCRTGKGNIVLVPNRVKTVSDAETVVPTLQTLSEGKASIADGIGDRVNHRKWTV
ncbi:MAG: ParA family protein, partial [Alphaproteobacteria bacterium]|nr:ParA family protein [Alphaproteobacteria bacterium]